MTHGVLDAKEPESLRVIREILTSMLRRPASARCATSKQKLCFTIPAAPLGAESTLTYHETTLRQILSELGYQPVAINEGLAVIYGELESSNYTGIGISCGGGLCNVCLAYLSVPVVSFSIPKAGDFIDSSAAAVTGERSHLIRLTKEDSFHFNGFFADKMHQVIGVYYDDMIRIAGGRAQRRVHQDQEHAGLQPSHPDGAEWRHGAAPGLPRPLRKNPMGAGFPYPGLRNPHVARSAAFHRQRAPWFTRSATFDSHRCANYQNSRIWRHRRASA